MVVLCRWESGGHDPLFIAENDAEGLRDGKNVFLKYDPLPHMS